MLEIDCYFKGSKLRNLVKSAILGFLTLIMSQPHLAQCYSRTRRIALILCGARESEIYFEVQPGVNKLDCG